MNISKDVIRDLLPVYLAGEASPETRVLLETALGSDPELRAEAESLRMVPIPDVAPPAELGLASLKRTQVLLRRKVSLVGFCYMFTALPLALAGRTWGPVWFGIPALRLLATACLLAALIGWVAFVQNAVRLRATGLEPRRSWGPSLVWIFVVAGWGGYSTAVVAHEWIPKDIVYPLVANLVGAAIYLVGFKLHQFRRHDELERVETLLTLAHDRDPLN